MFTYNSFDKLPVWKSAQELAVLIYKITIRDNVCKDYGFRDQIRRSSVSISSNIAEGFERGSKQEFIQFLYIARGSCGELRSQLHLAQNIGYLRDNEFNNLVIMALKVSKQINGFIEYLKTSDSMGQKYTKKV